MTNIAGQIRDETRSLRCPKCKAAMEQVTFDNVNVDRCVTCRGIWFDARENEQLKGAAGSEALDNAQASSHPETKTVKIQCPVCHTPMIGMTDHAQPHLRFESCTVCYGTFFDAGEFRDYKEVTITEMVKSLFNRPKM